MAVPIILLALGAGLAAAAVSAPKKKVNMVAPDGDATPKFLEWAQTCPLDDGLEPLEADAIRILMLTGVWHLKTPMELAEQAQGLAARGRPRAAACVAGLAQSLQQLKLKR